MLKLVYTFAAFVTIEIVLAICFFGVNEKDMPIFRMSGTTSQPMSSGWRWGHDSTGLIATFLCKKAMSYKESVEYCAVINSSLAEIENINDYSFFRDTLTSENLTNMSVWLGHAYDSQSRVWRRVSNNKTILWDGWKPSSGMNQSQPHSYGLSLSGTLPFFCVLSRPRQLLEETISSVPTVHLNYRAEKDFEAKLYNEQCTGATCFDVTKCQSKSTFQIHIQKVNDFMSLGLSVEFYELYIWLINSPYYTENPTKACLIVPDLDFLATHRYMAHAKQVGEYLQNNAFWEGGSNHVIFNFAATANHFDSLPVGNSLIASSSLRHSKVRLGFDVSIPYYSNQVRYFVKRQREVSHETSERTIDLVVLGNIELNVSTNLAKFTATNNAVNVVIMRVLNCDNDIHFDIRKPACDQFGKNHNVGSLLAKSRYCLVTLAANGQFQNSFLSFALGSGCIPLIIAPDHVLPYGDVIDWTRATISIMPYDILYLSHFLNQLDKKTERVRSLQCHFLFDHYFKTIGQVAQSFIDYMQQRLYIKIYSYEYWNGDQISTTGIRVFGKAADKGFTAVILTFDRFDYLVKLIKKLATVSSCKKVLIIWQNQDKPLPKIDTLPRIGIPIVFKQVTSNILSNRFYPYDEIETSCVLSVDDDMDFLTTEELEFGYATWRSNPDRLVGFPGRNHYFNGTNWIYDASWGNDVTMVLTGAAFYHSYYNYAFTYETSKKARDFVDEHMNCEDILMNYVVEKMTGKAPVKVTPRRSFKSPTKENSYKFNNDTSDAKSTYYTFCIQFYSELL